jgi:hypothetical protein
MSAFSKNNVSVTPQIIGGKINNSQYRGPNGAIALANQLGKKDYNVPAGKLEELVTGARLNVYYSAASHYNELGGKNRFLGLYYSYRAKKLADSFYLLPYFHHAPQMFLCDSEYPDIVQQCQATYRAWAMAKAKFGLSIKTEWEHVLALQKAVSDNKNSTYLLKTLAEAVIYEFPRASKSERGMIAYRHVIAVINKLNDEAKRTADESQVLSRLLRSVGYGDRASQVAKDAGLPDQITKAHA